MWSDFYYFLMHYFLLIRFIFVVICPAWQVLRKHLHKVLPRNTVDSVEYSDFSTVQDPHVFIKKEKKPTQILVNYIHLSKLLDLIVSILNL